MRFMCCALVFLYNGCMLWKGGDEVARKTNHYLLQKQVAVVFSRVQHQRPARDPVIAPPHIQAHAHIPLLLLLLLPFPLLLVLVIISVVVLLLLLPSLIHRELQGQHTREVWSASHYGDDGSGAIWI